jgi:hypothetical protein
MGVDEDIKEVFLLKKSQISQVFTYIASTLVIGLLVIVGYKAIDMMMGKQCEARRAIFEKDLLNFIDEYSDYGSVHEEIIQAPCNTKEICFADASYFANYCSGSYPLPSPSIYDFPPDIIDSIITSAVADCKANIFLKREFTETFNNPTKFSDKISLNGDPFQCFKVTNSQFKLVFSGLGSKTLIEQG